MLSLDWTVVGVYFALVLGLGLGVGRRIKNFFDYFLAGRSLPMWAVGISAIAAETSAATFIGAPDMAYRGNFAYLQTTIGSVLSRFLIAFFVIHIYYRTGVVTVYELLNNRYGRPTQLLGSLLFCGGRVLASGARVYIAGLAFSTIAGISLSTAICLLCGVALIYGVIGGLRAVVWVEVFQGFVFLSGGLIALWFVVSLQGGVTPVIDHLSAAGKLTVFDFHVDLFSAEFWANPYTFWGAVFGGLTLGSATHTSDQDMVQRLLACRGSREGRRSIIMLGLLEFPVALLFMSVGAALWAYYQSVGIEVPRGSSVFPFFIQTVMPAGLRGLLLASILASAMSSLNSTITALSSVTIRDIFPMQENLSRARWMSLFWALVLMGTAILLGGIHQSFLQAANGNDPSRRVELLTFALGVMALIYGPLLSMFLLALFTRRGNNISIASGTAAGCGLAVYLQFFAAHPIGWTWQIVLSTFVSLVICALGRSTFENTPAALS